VWYAPAGDPPRAPVVRRVEGLRSSGATPLHLVLDHDLPAIGRGVTAREIGQEIGQLIGLTGLDVTLAFQRAFSPFGTTLGATVSWTHVP